MLIGAEQCWLILIGADWYWLMLIDVDRCWLMGIDADWSWLILIDADWCWLMLIDGDWCWLILIDSDWCWLVLIDADCCSKKRQPGFLLSMRTSGASLVIFSSGLEGPLYVMMRRYRSARRQAHFEIFTQGSGLWALGSWFWAQSTQAHSGLTLSTLWACNAIEAARKCDNVYGEKSPLQTCTLSTLWVYSEHILCTLWDL